MMNVKRLAYLSVRLGFLAPHTHELRDVPQCEALSLLQKPLFIGVVQQKSLLDLISFYAMRDCVPHRPSPPSHGNITARVTAAAEQRLAANASNSPKVHRR
jgi:hypothetical protein